LTFSRASAFKGEQICQECCVPMTFVSIKKPATKTPAATGGTTR
jgi:hypothetical protein